MSNNSVEVIDTEMNVVRTLPTEYYESAVVDHKLKFGKSNLYSFTAFVIKPDGERVLSEYTNYTVGSHIGDFGQVSDDGYLLAKAMRVDNNLEGAAILRPTGEIVWVISMDPGYSMPISTSWLPYKGDDSGKFSIKTVNIHQSPLGPKM